VLTAAHCGFISQVSVGNHNIYETSSQHAVLTNVPHPLYDDYTSDYDFALLYLADEIDLALYPAIALNADNAAYQASSGSLFAAGWGTTEVGADEDGSGGLISPVLLSVSVPLLSNADCEATENDGITDRMVCAGEEGKDACQGDSGGPLFDLLDDGSFVQVGVTSYGFGCGDDGYPGVFARVSDQIDWINDVLYSGNVCENFCMECGTGAPSQTERHLLMGDFPADESSCEVCNAIFGTEGASCDPDFDGSETEDAFTCNNGCEISPEYENDAYCDCAECEDERDFTCETCGGCPKPIDCGDYIECGDVMSGSYGSDGSEYGSEASCEQCVAEFVGVVGACACLLDSCEDILTFIPDGCGDCGDDAYQACFFGN